MIAPAELRKVTDCWGQTRYVRAADFDNPRKMLLTLYCSTGLSMYDWAEQMRRKNVVAAIHRANILGTPEHAESQKAVAAFYAANQ